MCSYLKSNRNSVCSSVLKRLLGARGFCATFYIILASTLNSEPTRVHKKTFEIRISSEVEKRGRGNVFRSPVGDRNAHPARYSNGIVVYSDCACTTMYIPNRRRGATAASHHVPQTRKFILVFSGPPPSRRSARHPSPGHSGPSPQEVFNALSVSHKHYCALPPCRSDCSSYFSLSCIYIYVHIYTCVCEYNVLGLCVCVCFSKP